jgi:hypothetical protein
MNASALLARLRALGVTLTAVGDVLRLDAPRGALTSQLVDAVRQEKPALLALLRSGRTPFTDAHLSRIRTRLGPIEATPRIAVESLSSDVPPGLNDPVFIVPALLGDCARMVERNAISRSLLCAKVAATLRVKDGVAAALVRVAQETGLIFRAPHHRGIYYQLQRVEGGPPLSDGPDENAQSKEGDDPVLACAGLLRKARGN